MATHGTSTCLAQRQYNTVAGNASSYPYQGVELNNKIFFTASHELTGTELWATDGTTAGTYMVKDISLGEESSYPNAPFAVGDTLFFAAGDGIHGIELWKSKGTAAITQMVADISPFYSSSPQEFVLLGDQLLFTAYHEDYGAELWRLDLNGISGIEEEMAENPFQLFPNPTAENFTLKGHLPTGAHIRVVNQLGAAITTISFTQSYESYVISLSNYPEGVYFIGVETAKGTHWLKGVKVGE